MGRTSSFSSSSSCHPGALLLVRRLCRIHRMTRRRAPTIPAEDASAAEVVVVVVVVVVMMVVVVLVVVAPQAR